MIIILAAIILIDMRHFCTLRSNYKLNKFQTFIQNHGIKTMQSWQILKYGSSSDELQLNTVASIPVIRNPFDVLIKVHAASVNPIDVRMLEGYGATTFNLVRQLGTCSLSFKEFPLVLGRDFSGIVVHVGKNVKNIRCGDEVWGATSPWQDGSHAEYVLAPVHCISKKPSSLSHTEASSFPYIALTAWSALTCFGGLSEKSAYNKRVLVTGASGGVGTFAVQVLKAWGANVTATCGTDAVEMVQNLGVDNVLDYHDPDFKNQLKDMKNFDLILDNVGKDYPSLTIELLKKWQNTKYVSLVSPLLQNSDKHGIVFGMLKSTVQAAADTVMSLKDGTSFRWAYFMPNGWALEKIGTMINKKQIIPVIDSIFSFMEVPGAYEKAINGHPKGKIVINFLTEVPDAEEKNDDKMENKI